MDRRAIGAAGLILIACRARSITKRWRIARWCKEGVSWHPPALGARAIGNAGDVAGREPLDTLRDTVPAWRRSLANSTSGPSGAWGRRRCDARLESVSAGTGRNVPTRNVSQTRLAAATNCATFMQLWTSSRTSHRASMSCSSVWGVSPAACWFSAIRDSLSMRFAAMIGMGLRGCQISSRHRAIRRSPMSRCRSAVAARTWLFRLPITSLTSTRRGQWNRQATSRRIFTSLPGRRPVGKPKGWPLRSARTSSDTRQVSGRERCAVDFDELRSTKRCGHKYLLCQDGPRALYRQLR